MLKNKLHDIFRKVQQSTSCHQKYRQILRNIYNETSFDDFEIEFMRCIEILLGQDITHKNVHVDRSLEFIATFIGMLAENEIKENDTESDISTHPFLHAMICNILEYHNLDYISARYRTCQLVDLILRNIGEDAHIENDLWNIILESLLERIKDLKPTIRIQAIKALARLQAPTDSECPVIQAFLGRMYDCSPMVRKEMVELIAPTPITSTKIVEKVRDSDHNVRIAAYRKCSKMGPKMVKLIDRQSVVFNGFNETNEVVKKCFLEDTLPKWLSAYNGDFLKLLHALKVDAFAEDMEQTEVVCKNVLEVFFKTHPLTEIIEYLPIDENKVIPLDKLTYEAVLYWRILVSYLRKSEDTEDYLDNVIPELLPFSVYIESIVKENCKISDGWKYDEYQHKLSQLLQLAGNYDLGDEVTRKALRTLLVEMLTITKLDIRNITEIIAILYKMNPVLDSLTIDICSIISEIREPMVQQPPSQDMLRQNDFKVAELRVKKNILTEDWDEAILACDFEKAAIIKGQLQDLNKKIEAMVKEFEASKTMVKTSQNDTETVCRCLNILIGILSHPKLKTLTISLRSCKDEFVVPLCDTNDPQVSWRVFKCIALCCTVDRQLTLESLKLICSPVIFYHLSPLDEGTKQVLLVSIGAVSDLVRLFGSDIFENQNNSNNTTNNANSTIRRRLNGTKRLYRTEHVEDLESFDFQSITWKDIMDILLEMLDDEHKDIREQACRGVCELVCARRAMSSDIMARLIIKWFNPLTEKHDQKVQLLLGNTFVRFALMEGTEEIFEQSVIPVLTVIGNAPMASPLADVDLDNALRFLSAITSMQKQSGLNDVHKNLAYNLCNKILAKHDDKCVPVYIKMLLNLELFLEDSVIVKELINQAELILEDIVDRAPKRNVQKFVFKLNKLLAENENNKTGENETVTDQTEETESLAPTEAVSRLSVTEKEVSVQAEEPENLPEEEINKQKPAPPKANTNNIEKSVRPNTRRLSNINLKDTPVSSPVKRRKRRGRRSKEASIAAETSEETILHTIIEDDEIEMQIFEEDDMTIETPSTDSLSNSSGSLNKRRRPKKVGGSDTSDSDRSKKLRGSSKCIVSETSSDTDAPQKKTVRRSGRKRKSKASKYC